VAEIYLKQEEEEAEEEEEVFKEQKERKNIKCVRFGFST